MPRFTVRVVLHNASPQNYVDLANSLATKGVVDVIRSDDGTLYKLPPAEYNFEGNASAEQVRDAVVQAASITNRFESVLVTETQKRVWQGLQAFPQPAVNWPRRSA